MPSLRDMTEHAQDDIIYFVVTDRFFGTKKRMVEPSDTPFMEERLMESSRSWIT